MNASRLAAIAAASCLALGLTAARAQPEAHPVHVDMLRTCRQGLVVWLPLPPEPKCGFVQVPQVKVFDGDGRLRFVGSALDAMQWAKAGLPATPIPKGIRVRDAASEARVTHAAAPPAGQGWVTYYGWRECPPCAQQLATLRTDVMPKLAPGTVVTVLDFF